ncbi:MAG: hypothetical protein COC06_05455 [Bacteroidales bacterium]|nr:MAG: hypothetical protein COC06_05455 [Bacteroidales bacterium]
MKNQVEDSPNNDPTATQKGLISLKNSLNIYKRHKIFISITNILPVLCGFIPFPHLPYGLILKLLIRTIHPTTKLMVIARNENKEFQGKMN